MFELRWLSPELRCEHLARNLQSDEQDPLALLLLRSLLHQVAEQTIQLLYV
jgi:hypothetical protein